MNFIVYLKPFVETSIKTSVYCFINIAYGLLILTTAIYIAKILVKWLLMPSVPADFKI